MNPTALNISRVACKSSGRIDIKFSLANRGDADKTDTVKIESHDAPQKSFVNAFQGLKKTVLELCEYIDEKAVKVMTITAVSITHKDDRIGATISAKIKLETSNSPFNVTTPYKEEAVDDESANCLTEKQVAAIRKAMREAASFAAGERAQLYLLPNPGEDGAPETGEVSGKQPSTLAKAAASS